MRFVDDFIGADSGFNKLGHRCKNISEIDLDNYILFTGCSHTLGEGLEIEQTFPHIVASKLNKDYYNLGLSGSGIDVLIYNLVHWFNVIKKKPKLLVVQFPDYTRFSVVKDNTENIVPRGNWHNESNDFIIKAIDNGTFNFRKLAAIKTIQSFDVPTITFVHGNTKPYDEYSLRMQHMDYADDKIHSGTESHKKFSSILIDTVLDKY